MLTNCADPSKAIDTSVKLRSYCARRRGVDVDARLSDQARVDERSEMAKYSLVMTPTPCRVAGCIISIRPTRLRTHVLMHLLPYLLTYTVGSGV